MNNARYVELKRFAVHDGPGIRSTLFLKGCPLRCLWCHNPETVSAAVEIGFHANKCIHCGACAQVCDCHTVTASEHRFDRSRCTACGKCVDVCLPGALERYGKTISVEEAAELILSDRDFYASSGGGATVSGGEPLLQSEFVAALFRRLKAENIHCAVDTCGNVPWEAFETVLLDTDLFLYDFKAADSARHRALTGSGNDLILENLKRLDQTGKPIEIRMVMVPEHNMAPEDLDGAGAFLATLRHVTAVRLLAYHSLAHAKYRSIGHPDTLPEVPSPSPEMLQDAGRRLEHYGLTVILPD